jgi:ribonuclease Z
MMEIVFLGTGGSFPSPQRGVSSVALKTHGEVLLFDCGEGTQRQLMRSSLSFMGITKIFITHFHGDHYLGLAGLLQTMALNGRTKDLEIFGPKGTEQLVTILERISYYSRTYDLVLHEIKENQKEHFEGYSVTAIRLDHSIPTLGYLFEEDDRPGKFDTNAARLLGIPPGPLYNKLQGGDEIVWNEKVIEPSMVMGPPRPGRKITIAMDTKPILGLPERIKGFDILIHEATSDKTLEGKANKFGHSTAAQAATIAKEADVKRLFLIHISPRYRDPRPLIEEAKEIFEETYLPSDLDEFEVPLPESWVEEDKLWVVAEDKKGEEGEQAEADTDLEATDGMPTEADEQADATLAYDEPIPGEVTADGDVDLMAEPPIPTEVTADGGANPVEAAIPDEEPVVEPAITEDGISLGAVAAAMESKTSHSDEEGDLEVVTEVPEPVPSGDADEDDDEEFDLEAAMKEVGLDPNAD